MPVMVRARRKGEGGQPWKVVERKGGKVVGQSNTKALASARANARNAAAAKAGAAGYAPYKHKKKRRG